MKKISKLFAIAPLALAMIFGGMISAEEPAETAPGNPDKADSGAAEGEDFKYPVKMYDASAYTKDPKDDTVVLKQLGGKDIEIVLRKGHASTEDAKAAAVKLYNTEYVKKTFYKKAVEMKLNNYNSETRGLKLVDYYVKEGTVYLGFAPAEKHIKVYHLLVNCAYDAKNALEDKDIITGFTERENVWVPFTKDLVEAEEQYLKGLSYNSPVQVMGSKLVNWKPFAISYVSPFNDSNIISFIDLNGDKQTVANNDKGGFIRLLYKDATCPAKKDDKKVDAASDEEKKEESKPAEKTEEKKPMENKTLPATGSSSSVVLFLSAAVLLGSGLVLVKKH